MDPLRQVVSETRKDAAPECRRGPRGSATAVGARCAEGAVQHSFQLGQALGRPDVDRGSSIGYLTTPSSAVPPCCAGGQVPRMSGRVGGWRSWCDLWAGRPETSPQLFTIPAIPPVLGGMARSMLDLVKSSRRGILQNGHVVVVAETADLLERWGRAGVLTWRSCGNLRGSLL